MPRLPDATAPRRFLLRYERRFDYGEDAVGGDTISGIARGGLALARGVTLEAGAMAARTHVEGNGRRRWGGYLDSDAEPVALDWSPRCLPGFRVTPHCAGLLIVS